MSDTERGTAEIVDAFQAPTDVRGMGYCTEREAVLFGFVIARHARTRRRGVRERIVFERLRLSRSVGGRGSEQAATVARNPRTEEDANPLAKLFKPQREERGPGL